MLGRLKIGFVLVFSAVLAVGTSCKKKQTLPDSLVIGHWGCEQYVSCRTDSLGIGQWDTSRFEAVAGGEYELFFNSNGKGLLKLNNSPALIKEFSCNYVYDSARQTLTVESSSWLYALYGSLFLDENRAVFDMESITDSTMVASWTNRFSEPQPFFERFFIKRID